jgi:hypothetical protein
LFCFVATSKLQVFCSSVVGYILNNSVVLAANQFNFLPIDVDVACFVAVTTTCFLG